MIVDPVEDVGEVCLWVEAAHLRALDKRHRTRQGFAAGIRSGEEPVFPPDADRAHGALGCIVVDGEAAIVEEEREGRPPVQGVAEGLGEIALAGNAGQLLLGPDLEGRDLVRAVFLAGRKPQVRRLAGDLALDVVELSDAIESLARDLRFVGRPHVMV